MDLVLIILRVCSAIGALKLRQGPAIETQSNCNLRLICVTRQSRCSGGERHCANVMLGELKNHPDDHRRIYFAGMSTVGYGAALYGAASVIVISPRRPPFCKRDSVTMPPQDSPTPPSDSNFSKQIIYAVFLSRGIFAKHLKYCS